MFNRTTRQKIDKETEDVNNNIYKLDLPDIYRTLYLTGTEYAFSSSIHGTFYRTDNMVGHKTNFNYLRKLKLYKVLPVITME